MEVKENKEFMSMTARMSCLVTMAQMNDDLEVSQLIDALTELKISKTYLIISMETLNATLLKEKTITFNVIIHHKESGQLCGVESLRYFWGPRMSVQL